MLAIRQISNIRSLRQTSDIWEGARRQTRIRLDDGGPADLVLWACSDGVRTFDLVRRGELVDMVELLQRAMHDPMPPFRPEAPTAVTLDIDERSCQTAIEAAGMQCVPPLRHSNADRALGFVEVSFARKCYLLSDLNRPEEVRAFFAAACEFYRDAPWRKTSDTNLLEIRGASTSPIWVSVLGNAGIARGVAIFLNSGAARAMLQGSPETAFSMGVVSLVFETWEETNSQLRLEIEEHGWPLISKDHVPLLTSHRGEVARTAHQQELTLAADVLLAVRRCLLHGDRSPAVPSGRVLHASWPVKLFDLPTVSAGRVGRNDACRCGSGKKFKRCCG